MHIEIEHDDALQRIDVRFLCSVLARLLEGPEISLEQMTRCIGDHVAESVIRAFRCSQICLLANLCTPRDGTQCRKPQRLKNIDKNIDSDWALKDILEVNVVKS